MTSNSTADESKNVRFITGPSISKNLFVDEVAQRKRKSIALLAVNERSRFDDSVAPILKNNRLGLAEARKCSGRNRQQQRYVERKQVPTKKQ
eukprot:scaffold11698_cov138-Cylindrotheca_fusiformis.AAC.7